MIRLLEVDETPLVVHDDKVAALTMYYTNILSSEVPTT
jgi:hypothetical protein